MSVSKVDLRATHSFSNFFLDFVEDEKELRPFYGLRPDPSSFEKQMGHKLFDRKKRKILCQILTEQYQSIENAEIALSQIETLGKDTTYTLTTGHQLNIFTGPLYFIYKIITVINAAKRLKAEYPKHDFVPVYWMASEDHDFDEISYFHLFGKKYQWESTEKGGVGRISTNGLEAVLKELPEAIPLFEKAYKTHKKLADAVRCYVNDLFGQYGLIVIDADSAQLKTQFVDVIKDDLENHTAHALIEKTNSDLSDLGYKAQIFPRKINFFYLDDQIRERITMVDGKYVVNNADLSFTKEEILDLIETSPEKFSPNVAMRPLYQETILPNLSYTGGPAEVVYWMQLQKVFRHYKIALPIQLPRNFACYINRSTQKKLEKFELSHDDLFKSVHDLQTDYLALHGANEMNLNGEATDLQVVYDHLIQKAEVIDASLTGFIGAEHAKALKGLEIIEKRLKKSEEQKHQIALNQLAGLKQKLFPDDSLQERRDNFLNFYINNPNLIKELIDQFDPFDMRMHVVSS